MPESPDRSGHFAWGEGDLEFHSPRTSQTHPLRIAEITTGPNRGRIGITFAPGKIQPNAMSGAWRRDLATDLDAIADWNAAAVITLLEPHEL